MIGYGQLQTKKVGGWSDSCLAAAEGVPVVCAMGVKGANNHSMEEYAVAETLFSRAKLALHPSSRFDRHEETRKKYDMLTDNPGKHSCFSSCFR